MNAFLIIYLMLSSFSAGIIFRHELEDPTIETRTLIINVTLVFLIGIPVFIFIKIQDLFTFFELKYIFEIMFTSKHDHLTDEQITNFYNWEIRYKDQNSKIRRWYKGMISDLVLSKNGLSTNRKEWDYTVSMKPNQLGDLVFFLQHPLENRVTMPRDIGINEIPESIHSRIQLLEIAKKLNQKRPRQ